MTVTLSTTTNNTFRYPSASNNGTDFSTGIADFAADVDGMWRRGTLASRPAANAVADGTVYRGTDTGLWYESNGTAWQTMMLAGAWTTLTLSGGLATTSGHFAVAARAVGDSLELRGGATNGGSTVAKNTALFTLPTGLRPASTVEGSVDNNGSADVLRISTAGVATMVNNDILNGQYASFDSLRFSLV